MKTMCHLDSEAAQALKQFAKKNKPRLPARSMFSSEGDIGSEEEGGIAAELRASNRAATTHVSASYTLGEQERHSASEPPKSAVSLSGLASDASTESSLAAVPAPLVKFDIFDNIDEERVREFEERSKEARAGSNYATFKAKSKKADPNKFATCNGINTNDQGQRVLS